MPGEILLEQGIDTGTTRVLVLRHTPKEPQLRKELPRLAVERPDFYNAYQQTQSAKVEKMMKKAEYVASFIGHEPGKARFVGLYTNRGKPQRLTKAACLARKENRELCKLGMRGWTDGEGRSFILWFQLKLEVDRTRRIGQLVIKWPGRAIIRSKWADKFTFPVLERTLGRRANSEASAPHPTPKSSDIAEPPKRIKTATYRILRDTAKARRVKELHEFNCQICGHRIKLSDGSHYAAAHHIQPLGGEHNGLNVSENILCVCPNHHAELDLGVAP